MNEWITAALRPQDVVPVNGRAQEYSSAATALAYVVMGRLMEYDLWRNRESSGYVPDLLADDQMPSSEWDLVRSALRSMLDESQEFGTLELAEFAFNSELDSELRVVACLLASIGYADMEMYTESVAECERLLKQQLNLSVLPKAMIQLHACLRNAEIKNYSRALYWGHSARTLLEAMQLSSSDTTRKIVDGLRFSVEENILSLNDAVSDKITLGGPARPTSPAFWLELNATAGAAAVEYVAEDFKHRIRDRALRRSPHIIRNEDYISRNMYAYYVRVQLAGHWQKYLQASRQLGMERMLRPIGEPQDSAGQLSQGLVYLRKGWASNSYKEALRLVREEGPLEALDSELQKALARLQHGVTDLEFQVLRAGAPLLRAEEADSVCRSLLENPLPRRARSAQGWYQTQVPLWDAVSALAREMSDGDYLSQYMRACVGDADSTQAFHIDKAAKVLDWNLVSVSEQEDWIDTLQSNTSVEGDWRVLLDTVLYKLCGTGNRAALELLRQMSESEMTLARSAYIVDLPDEFGADLLGTFSNSVADLCVRAIVDTRDNAAQGAWSFGDYNAALIGAIFSIKRPEREIWSVLAEFLRDRSVAADHKEPVLDALAFHVGDIPAEVVQRISSDPARLTSIHPGLFNLSGQGSGSLLRFLCAAGAIEEGEAFAALVRLSDSEEPNFRIEAGKSLPLLRKVVGDSLAFGYLLHMTMDPSILVRAQAAETLGYFLASESVNDALVSQRLIQMLGSDGVAVPFGALRGLRMAKRDRGSFSQPEIVDTLHRISRDHAMARVRKAANSLLA